MNIYLLVEGKTEKRVYPKWIKYMNPQIQVVQNIREVSDNHLYVVFVGGQGRFYDEMKNAFENFSEYDTFDRLVIAIDSEGISYDKKKAEVTKEIVGILSEFDASIDYRVVVQHFCIETWALGNREITLKPPSSERVLNYKEKWDVSEKDPERLPPFRDEGLNRAKSAYKYFKALLNEDSRDPDYPKTYTKGNPQAILNNKFFSRVKARLEETGHIASFNDFLTAFV